MEALGTTLLKAERLVCPRKRKYLIHGIITTENTKGLITELRYLFILFCCGRVLISRSCVDASSSSSSFRNPKTNENLEFQLTEVAAATKKLFQYLKKFLSEGFYWGFPKDYDDDQDIFRYKPELSPEELCDPVGLILSTIQSFQPDQPRFPTEYRRLFNAFLWYNLFHLNECSYLDDPLIRMQIEAWDSNIQTSQWLQLIGCYDDWKDAETSIDYFLSFGLDLNKIEIHSNGNREPYVLYTNVELLLACLIKIPQMMMSQDTDEVHQFVAAIKNVVMEAKDLPYYRCYYDKSRSQFAIVFAKIWRLKVEISIKSGGTLFPLSTDQHIHSLWKEYRFLQRNFQWTKESPTEYRIWNVIKEIPQLVESFCRSSSVDDGAEENNNLLVHLQVVSNVLFRTLVHILLLKAKQLTSSNHTEDAEN
ncbi:OLC1v1000160C1 [Oldenlandia corymbosa var. corymbosa]|uniref:OLC1v1000160C1 n=1 Tax=Oldenlandia corymbosa var. corymbosa TaxID=529605 RepID=A0AAV1D278_OLDCO|nr:OLC1v1000160C1 [Oldenlandia corymbosa var. corymbosa]